MNHINRGLGGLMLGVVLAWSWAGAGLRADEKPLTPEPSVDVWQLHFVAGLEPDRSTPLNDSGAKYEDCDAWFAGTVLVVVEQDGSFAFETRQAEFHQKGRWKSADGKTGDYHFDGEGTLRGTGTLVKGEFSVKLAWLPGEGRGNSSGQTLTKAAFGEPVKSDWKLKPLTPTPEQATAAKRVLRPRGSASQRGTLKEPVPGCPALPLLQTLSLSKWPAADLIVTAQAPELIGKDGRRRLKLTVRNRGPDESPNTLLRVNLPPGCKMLVPAPDPAAVRGLAGGAVTIELGELAKDGVSNLDIEFETPAEEVPPKGPVRSALVRVSGAGYDPNQANNGRFLRASAGTGPDKVGTAPQPSVRPRNVANPKALSEKDLASLIELRIADSAVLSRIKKTGVAPEVDDAALERLKQAGSSEAVLAALREAIAAKKTPATSPPLTYADVLRLLSLGVDEPAILRRHAKSPAALTFDASQMAELKRAGASPKLLAALSAGAGAGGENPADKPAVAGGNMIPGWGEFVDPEGDCKFRRDDEALTITVPGEVHDLWPVKSKVNAPLVLQDAEGDFTVEVKVAHVDRAAEGTVIPGTGSSTAFHAGTLVIWQDNRNFVRLDRTDMNKAGRGSTSCYLHVFQDGERVVEVAELVKDTPTHLRLQRRGDQLTAAYSQDGGQTWQSFPVQKIGLADKVQAGVSALNATSRPCEVRFEDIQLKN